VESPFLKGWGGQRKQLKQWKYKRVHSELDEKYDKKHEKGNKMKKRISLALALIMIMAVAFTGCGDTNPADDGAAGVEIQVSAAASLTDALNEIISEYAKGSNDTITPNYAGSGTLVQQIQEGAPCDLFISASKGNMDQLQEAGLIDETSRVDLLGNTLSLIASAETADFVTIETLVSPEITTISAGEPETVPAGKYATQVFEFYGITDAIKDKIVYGKDVRAVLDYVDSGNADCGFVYKTDAMLLTSGVIIQDMPADSHDPIVYPSAIIADTENADAAATFFDFLKTDYAKGVFESYGFTVL